MKKLIYCAAALATALFAGSCQQELLETTGSETTVTYSVELPGAVTKAGETDSKIGDGSNVTELIYELWLVGDDAAITSSSTRLFHKTTPMLKRESDGKRHASVTLNLVQDQKYRVLFWAQVGGKEIYVTDNLTSVTYKKDLAKGYQANQEDYAAFYATEVISTVTPPKSKTIELKRPFAQINIGTENTLQSQDGYTIDMNNSYVQVRGIPTTFNVATSVTSDPTATITFNEFKVPSETLTVDQKPYEYVAMNYVFASAKGIAATVEYNIYATLKPTATGSSNVDVTVNNTIDSVPLKENYRTNIVGNLLSSSTQYEIVVDAEFNDKDLDGGKFGVIDGQQYIKVENSADFTEAVANENVDIIILEGDINLNDIVTRSATDVTLTVKAGRTLTLDLNGKTLSGTSAQSGVSYHMFNVLGTLTVKNGTIEYEHIGEDMAWNHYAEIFHVGADGTLNMENVTANNKGGSTMAYVVDMSNATNITVNVENSTLKCSYIPVRVFNNSKTGVNNVTIKNSTLDGKYCFWVQYWLADDRDEAILKNTVKLDIFSDGNVYTKDENVVAPILFGYNSYVYCTPNGITKTVSEDGTVVTLGTMVENGVVARGVAGEEENRTITKAIVGEGITTLYDRTFRRFYALETVELPSTLTTIGAAGTGVFQSCNALKNIVIPESVTVLGKGTFQECSSLESINIPARVTRIEADALRATGLVSVEFHEGVTYFGAQAFRDCKQLKEVIINAPEFTVEANAFGVMAGDLPGTTIYVANAEMKAYLERTLDYKNQFTIVAPTVPETGAAAAEALEKGENVSLASDLTFSADETPNTGYGKAGLNVNGSVLNGNDHTITANDAWGTWDCTISATAGTIKNVTVAGAMRGIFMPGASDDVYIDNVTFSNVIYTFNSDAGNKNYGVYISNSTLNGWTSFSDCHKEVVFTNCSFGEGNGYAFCRPYNACVFENCEFSTDMEFDTTKQANIVFKNCTYGGVKITAENAASLKTGDVTFFYNGVGSVTFE